MSVSAIGIDLAKNTFSLHGIDEHGKVFLKKTVSRNKLLLTLANLPPCLIGMEACSGAHYWAREISKLGHDVRIMAPKFVIPYRKGGKQGRLGVRSCVLPFDGDGAGAKGKKQDLFSCSNEREAIRPARRARRACWGSFRTKLHSLL